MKLTPLQLARRREIRLANGLRKLALHFGVTFKEPLQIDSRGEFDLVVDNPEARKQGYASCGQYGTELAALLIQYNPRCGISPGAYLDAQNGWCMMNHFDVERMLKQHRQSLR